MLFAFESERIRDEAYKAFLKSELPNRIDYESSMSGSLIRKSVLDKWRSGKVSNFDYLMHLNTLAGRSFNDLTQYPVFPFVLAQYGAAELDLSDPASFRDFAAPMGAQDPGRLAKFEAKFEALQQMHAEAPAVLLRLALLKHRVRPPLSCPGRAVHPVLHPVSRRVL